MSSITIYDFLALDKWKLFLGFVTEGLVKMTLFRFNNPYME